MIYECEKCGFQSEDEMKLDKHQDIHRDSCIDEAREEWKENHTMKL